MITERNKNLLLNNLKQIPIVELACNSLECKLNSLPKKNIESYLAETFNQFIQALKG